MQQITSFKDLKTAINKNGEMIIFSDDNKIMLMELNEYNKKITKENIEQHLLKAEEDIENGRMHEAKEVFNQWKEQYGLQCQTD